MYFIELIYINIGFFYCRKKGVEDIETLLLKKEKSSRVYLRKTAEVVLKNVIQKIKEVNENEKFVYRVTKAVLFGSYINSTKEKIGDLDIAIYIELKNKSRLEYEQNIERAKIALSEIPYVWKLVYGKEEVFKYIKDKKKVLQLHDGSKIDKISKQNSESTNYIYSDKYKIIYEEVK